MGAGDNAAVDPGCLSVTVCPGLELRYCWPAAIATQLDREGTLVDMLNRRIRKVAEVWGAGDAWDRVRLAPDE